MPLEFIRKKLEKEKAENHRRFEKAGRIFIGSPRSLLKSCPAVWAEIVCFWE